MDVLKIFLMGFSLYYFIQLFDILLNIINSYASIIITKCNVKITELSEYMDKQDDGYRIGFQYEPVEDIYYEDEDDDYIDRKKNKL